MPALMAAAEAGLGVEVDVFYSTDGVLFAFHDDNMLELTGENVETADASWA